MAELLYINDGKIETEDEYSERLIQEIKDSFNRNLRDKEIVDIIVEKLKEA